MFRGFLKVLLLPKHFENIKVFFQMGENSNGQQKVDNKPQPRGRWARRIDSGEDLSQLEIAESRDGECTSDTITDHYPLHVMFKSFTSQLGTKYPEVKDVLK